MDRFHHILFCWVVVLLTTVGFVTAEDGEQVHLGIVPDTSTTAFDGTRGVVVKQVEPGHTAALMGMLPNDVITHFDSRPILRLEDLVRIRSRVRVGQEATITVKRGEEVIDLTGTLRPRLRPQQLKEKEEELHGLAQTIRSRAGREDNDLAANLRHLAQALNELPDRIEEAAKEFKKVYPKGEFTINIEIRISTDKTTHPAATITLGEGGSVPALLGGEEPGPEAGEEPDPEAGEEPDPTEEPDPAEEPAEEPVEPEADAGAELEP